MGTSIDLPDVAEIDALLRRLDGTSPVFRSFVVRYGATSSALRHFGLVEWQRGNLESAAEAIAAALALAPENPDLWRDLAGIADASLDEDSALRCVRQALSLDADSARSWLLLANLCSRRGESEEAETAFVRAIKRDPELGDAHFGLGLVYFAQRRVDEAALSLRAAIRHGYANSMGFTALGHVLYLQAEYVASIAAFDHAMTFGPLENGGRRKYLRARMIQAMIKHGVEGALALYATLADPDGEDVDEILRGGFAALSAFGPREAAVAVGVELLQRHPNDPSQRYLLQALTGEAATRAPADYVETHFDAFAEKFDRQLVDVLRYEAPKAMAALVTRHRQQFSRSLDLGCGTGLAAAALAPLGGHLTGVDLSGRMLEQAAKRGSYAGLVKADAVAFLEACLEPFDLIFAADVLIYFGDLVPVFAGFSRSMMEGGILALSIETGASGDYTLLPSGRFAHDPDYIWRLARDSFDKLDIVSTSLRLEANRPVKGLYLVLRRRGDDAGALPVIRPDA